MNIQRSKQVMNNNGLTPDKKHNTEHSRKQIPWIHPHDLPYHFMQILTP